MENKILVEQARSNSKITRFFYDLSVTKRPRRNASFQEDLKYLLKYYTGYCFFTLGNHYHSFISWITQYYPFSMLYRDRLFHHDNLKVKKFMIKLENIAKKEGINTLVISGGIDRGWAELIGYLDKGTKNREKVLSNLEAVLQKVYDTIYIRDQGDEFRILIPEDSFEQVVNH